MLTEFKESFPGWDNNHAARVHPEEPAVNWRNIPGGEDASDSEQGDSEEDELQDAESHIALDGAARSLLGDGEAPQMVSELQDMTRA